MKKKLFLALSVLYLMVMVDAMGNDKQANKTSGQPDGDCYSEIYVEQDTNYLRKKKAAMKAAAKVPAESNDSVTINLLVVYSPAAKAIATQGGDSIETLIQQAVQTSNLVMKNSNTGITFNLVHTQMVNYTEDPTSTNNDLQKLRSHNDGNADEAHALRTQYNADMVTLIIGNNPSNVNGAGYILASGILDYGGSPNSAFSAVKVNAIKTGYSFIHELGHNFGCGHHQEWLDGYCFSYSKGWRGRTSQNDQICTIMTYRNSSYMGWFDHIPYFSDPNISYGGTVIGASDMNNAKTIRITKKVVENYQQEVEWTDNFLRNIILSTGTLTPAFNSGIYNYTVTTTDSVIDVQGVKNTPLSKLVGDTLGMPLTLDSNNLVTLSVTDLWENKGQRNYTVRIARTVVPPVDTTVVNPPVDTTVVNPPVDTTVVTPPIDTTVVNPPVDTTVVNPPVDTTVVNPPVDTTVVNPPVDTTVVNPPDTTPTIPVNIDEAVRGADGAHGATIVPNPVRVGETINIRVNKEGILEIRELTGRLLQSIKVKNTLTNIKAPDKKGIYLYIFKTKDKLYKYKIVVL